MNLEQYRGCDYLPRHFKRGMDRNGQLYDIFQVVVLILIFSAIWVGTQSVEVINDVICALAMLVPLMIIFFFKSRQAKKRNFMVTTDGVVFRYGEEVKSVSYDEISSASVVCSSGDIHTVLQAEMFNSWKVYLELYDKNKEVVERVPLLVKKELILIATLMCLETNHLSGIFDFISEKDFLRWVNSQKAAYNEVKKLRYKTKREIYFSGLKKTLLGVAIFTAVLKISTFMDNTVSPLEMVRLSVEAFVVFLVMTLPLHFVAYRQTVLILEQVGELKK